MNKDEESILYEEWGAQILLNPFIVIYDHVEQEDKIHFMVYNRNDSDREMQDVCDRFAGRFLKATDYLELNPDNDVICIERNFLTALFLYLFSKAPPSEQNLCMICELINSDHPDDGVESDLDRLFNMLEEEQADHPALKEYNKYRDSGALRAVAYRSLRRRFRPLISISSNEENDIFAECSKSELMQLAASLVHNGSDEPLMPSAIYDEQDETVYATVALIYMMTTDESIPKTNITLFDMFRNPKDYARKITEVLSDLSPQDFSDLQEIISIWFSQIEKRVVSGQLKLSHLEAICDFFGEFQ